MSIKRVTTAIAVVFFSASTASAQTSRIDFTLVDAPYSTEHGARAPSMRQSLDFSVAGYEGMHTGIEKLFGNKKGLGRVAIVFADLATTVEVALPLTGVWVHEEFHRAAMGRRGIDSHNDVYDLNIASEWIAVSHVRDEDLARLKREHPAEWVRVNEAGLEGELLLVRDLERRRFFGQSTAWHLPLYWMTKLGNIGYVQSGTWDDADADVDEMNIDDGVNVPRRDFTGHDFLGWVYDLHRPTEAYEARGVHPSGVGIDRYRKLSHLTDVERRYLKKMGRLQLLNLADPFLFGVNDGIAVGKGVRVTAGLSHYLTSFGDAIDTNLWARRGETKLAFTVHAYRNGRRSFPGVEVELLDHAVTALGREWEVSPRLAVWTQPKDQMFDTRESSFGALTGVRVRTALTRRLGAFVDVEAKSAGWVAGSPYLDRNTSVRVGISAMAW